MNKICTIVEQSQKLIELGIDVNTADMMWEYNPDKEVYWNKPTIIPIDSYIFVNDIPAWSLSALMKLLPSEFTTENEFGKYKYEIKIRKYKLSDDVDLHQIAYGSAKFDVDGQYSFKDMINTGEKEDLLDAAFDMVCWLKENNKI